MEPNPWLTNRGPKPWPIKWPVLNLVPGGRPWHVLRLIQDPRYCLHYLLTTYYYGSCADRALERLYTGCL